MKAMIEKKNKKLTQQNKKKMRERVETQRDVTQVQPALMTQETE